MKYNYYVNGWRERKNYFFSFQFTEEEKERLENGETVEKDGNVFYIEETF